MLEVNPNYVNREQTDKLNVIDARWIDTTSGLFIDITTVRYNLTHPSGEGILSCKDGHEFRVGKAPMQHLTEGTLTGLKDTYLYPLRTTTFEGSPAKIPFMYKEMLENEYGPRSLVNTRFEG